MRTAYVVSRFPSTTETFIAREMSALRERGVEIELFALVPQPDAVVHPESRGFEAQSTRAVSGAALRAQAHWLRRRPGRLASVWWDAVTGNARSPKFLLRALAVVPMASWYAVRAQAHGVDRVHAHWATHSALAAWVVHRLTDLPYGITAHAHDIFVDRSMLGRKLRDADYVAVISEFNARFLDELYPAETRDKLEVVRCGIDPSSFAYRERTEHDGPVRLVCVASLQDYKGHAVLLEAMSVLTSRGRDVRLQLVGEGELRAELEADIARRGLDDRVELLGALPSDAVSAVLAESDVFVLPSVVTGSGKMEGIPVALMEASAVGLPVVASRMSGIPELVLDGETGLLVEPGDASQLADALDRLVCSAEMRARAGAAGRRRVLEEFTVVGNADRLLALMARDRREVVRV